jgi:hypothetical protein
MERNPNDDLGNHGAGELTPNAGMQLRDRAGRLKDSLADALETGAEKLRARGAGGGQIAGASATGGATEMVTDGRRVAGAANQLAGGMQASADWLRDADADSVKSDLQRQVKEHPVRALAVAVGLGVLLRRALRR